MPAPVLTQEGQETLDAILGKRAAIIQPMWKAKMCHILSLTMAAKGAKEAGKDLVIEAAKFVTNPGFSPYFERIENAEKHERERDWRWDKDAYYATQRRVKRWDSDAGRPLKSPGEMKVLALNASPRRRSNNEALIMEALRGAGSVGASGEYINLHSAKVGYCRGCFKCVRENLPDFCVIKDGMTEIYRKIIESDAIIIGFPIYTGREPAQLAAFFDRLAALHVREYSDDVRYTSEHLLKPGRRAMVIGTWGNRRLDMYDHVLERIIILLNKQHIEPVEALSVSGFAGLLKGKDEEGNAIIRRFPAEMEKAYLAGRTLVTGERNQRQGE